MTGQADGVTVDVDVQSPDLDFRTGKLWIAFHENDGRRTNVEYFADLRTALDRTARVYWRGGYGHITKPIAWHQFASGGLWQLHDADGHTGVVLTMADLIMAAPTPAVTDQINAGAHGPAATEPGPPNGSRYPCVISTCDWYLDVPPPPTVAPETLEDIFGHNVMSNLALNTYRADIERDLIRHYRTHQSRDYVVEITQLRELCRGLTKQLAELGALYRDAYVQEVYATPRFKPGMITNLTQS